MSIPAYASEPIDVHAADGELIEIRHGLGRPVLGFSIIWKDGPLDLFVEDPAAYSDQSLILRCAGTASARVVLIS